MHHLLLLLFFITQFSSLPLLSLAFIPDDNFLISCGSNGSTTVDGRTFIGDLSSPGLVYLSSSQSLPVKDQKPSQVPSPLYQTARVFTTESSYDFNLKTTGAHFVRLHFFPFTSTAYDLISARFDVWINGVYVLISFSVSRNGSNSDSVVLKEYIFMVDKEKVHIKFRPVEESGFGFVNAIEVFSAPSDLIADVAILVGSDPTEDYKGLLKKNFETVHRVNVGGQTITPFNDTLWRTWIPDDEFLFLKNAGKNVNRTTSPNYQRGWASREIAPDHVYMTAKEMNRILYSSVANFNITWNFAFTSVGPRYLVRLHFCDIVSTALDHLYFDVYVNGYYAYKNLDLSGTLRKLAVPYYIDFVVESEGKKSMQISVGPSVKSTFDDINAILNGVEIIKMMDSPSQTGSMKKLVRVLVGSALGVFFLICAAVLAKVTMLKFKKKSGQSPSNTPGWSPLVVHERQSDLSERTNIPIQTIGLRISFADVQHATNNFDMKMFIGSGGFGKVYKGVLKDNTKVAVKRCVPGSKQGLVEFETEITVLSKISHRHLVALIGYCKEQSEMILVYEFMERGTLKDHLYGSGLPPLSWKQRLEICIGSAKGLSYLHRGSSQGIIHRDVKSTNILLDDKNVAKVADFGISKSGPSLDETHVTTGIKGTFGYLDPEYFRRQQLTEKSDVYSFGVVLLEVLCARPVIDRSLPYEQVNLAEWGLSWQKKRDLEQIIDPHLVGDIKPNSLQKFGVTVERCLSVYGVDRPTMSDVLWNLEYALQLQETGMPTEAEPHEHSTTCMSDLPVPIKVPRVPSSKLRISDDYMDQGSGTIQVFSQLVTNDGR